MTARKLSSEKRHVQRYDEACTALDALDTEAVGEALYAIDTYVGWLRNQLGAKRLTIQALNVELDEMRGSE